MEAGKQVKPVSGQKSLVIGQKTPQPPLKKGETRIEEFSKFDIVMERFRSDVADKESRQPVKPFPEAELSDEKRKERVKKSQKNFWFFDKTYFTEDMYSDGYSKPGKFLKSIVQIANQPGVQIILGARKHAKTAGMKKYFVWLCLTGKITFAGTLSQTLTTSKNILGDIYELIADNQRILNDFKPEFEEANTEQISFRYEGAKKKVRIMAFSEGRSVRGATKVFDRPQFILCDDLETRQSALGDSQTEERVRIINEAFHSLSNKGTLLVLGNNFDERCALNRLVREQEENILPKHVKVHIFPAWDAANKKPLWKERYPAKTEAQLRMMLEVNDEAEWLADFQQKPVPPDGMIFRRLNPLPTYRHLPDDARGVVYVDPNLAKKGRGDSTAIIGYLYSSAEDKYYLYPPVCRSFSDSNLLLDEAIKIYYTGEFGGKKRFFALGFDGWVGQESTWTNNVRLYCRIKDKPYPKINYCHYKTDDLAKNIQSIWNEGRLLLPEGIADTEDGRRFLTQFFAFSGKKANLEDDGPDALICSNELLHERHLGKRAVKTRAVTIINEHSF